MTGIKMISFMMFDKVSFNTLVRNGAVGCALELPPVVFVWVVVWGHDNTIRELPPSQCLLSLLTIDYWIKLHKYLSTEKACQKYCFVTHGVQIDNKIKRKHSKHILHVKHLAIHKNNCILLECQTKRFFVFQKRMIHNIITTHQPYLSTSWNIHTFDWSWDFNTAHHSVFRTLLFNIFQDICSMK